MQTMINFILTKLIVLYLFHTIESFSEVIVCTETNECVATEISCNSTETDNECEIQCNTYESCKNSTFYCGTNNHCNIICNEDGSCQGATVYCSENNNCSIECSSAFSCQEMTIYCPETGGHECNIKGIRSYSLHNMQFNCYGSICNVTCNGIASCLNATINGYYTKSESESVLNIGCNDNARDQGANEKNFACKDMNIYCPINRDGDKVCIVKGISLNPQKTAHTDLRIYAINSWNDIDLTEYKPTVGGKSRMFCNDNFSDSCLINNITTTNQWNCINKTSVCWIDYGSTEHINYPLIIGLSIGAFFLLIIALCIGLYLRKDEEIFAANFEKQEELNAERATLRTPSITEEIDDDDDNMNNIDFAEYRNLMQMVFYTFAGYKPWSKKTGLYLNKTELQTFLDIVNIQDPADEVLKLIDTDIEDGRITVNEWMDYFCDKNMNPSIFAIKQHIEGQVTWRLLCKALKIFEITDTNRTGKLEYDEFSKFGISIGLNEEETEILWDTLDTDNSGAINIIELFEWFRLRLYQQRGRIIASKQPSLLCSKSDLQDLEDFRSHAKSLCVDENKEDK